jgi:hypothetical protein
MNSGGVVSVEERGSPGFAGGGRVAALGVNVCGKDLVVGNVQPGVVRLQAATKRGAESLCLEPEHSGTKEGRQDIG